jgi:hypothetical protein
MVNGRISSAGPSAALERGASVAVKVFASSRNSRPAAAKSKRNAFDLQLEALINLLMIIEGNAEMAERHRGDERWAVTLSRVLAATDRAALLAHEMLAAVLQGR